MTQPESVCTWKGGDCRRVCARGRVVTAGECVHMGGVVTAGECVHGGDCLRVCGHDMGGW